MAAEEVLAVYKQYGIDAGGEKPAADEPAVAVNGTQTGPASQNLPRAPKTDTAVVWKLHPDNTVEPVKVSLGITDHAYTEVTSVLGGQLKEGDEVVIRSVVSKSQALGGLRR